MTHQFIFNVLLHNALNEVYLTINCNCMLNMSTFIFIIFQQEKREQVNNQGGDDGSLQMQNTSGIFLVLGAGTILGLIVAIIDFMMHAHEITVKEKVRINLFHKNCTEKAKACDVLNINGVIEETTPCMNSF